MTNGLCRAVVARVIRLRLSLKASQSRRSVRRILITSRAHVLHDLTGVRLARLISALSAILMMRERLLRVHAFRIVRIRLQRRYLPAQRLHTDGDILRCGGPRSGRRYNLPSGFRIRTSCVGGRLCATVTFHDPLNESAIRSFACRQVAMRRPRFVNRILAQIGCTPESTRC